MTRSITCPACIAFELAKGQLPEGQAPDGDCGCAVCRWARARQGEDSLFANTDPVRPDTPEWRALLALSRG